MYSESQPSLHTWSKSLCRQKKLNYFVFPFFLSAKEFELNYFVVYVYAALLKLLLYHFKEAIHFVILKMFTSLVL